MALIALLYKKLSAGLQAMFDTPVPMQHVSLTMMKEDAPVASISLARMELLHLIENSSAEGLLTELPAQEYQQIFQHLSNRFNKIAQYMNELELDGRRRDKSLSASVSLQSLQQADDDTRLLWSEISSHEENIHRAREKIHSANQLSASLSRFENLNTDLGKLSDNSIFLKIYIGTVPHHELKQLQRALSLANTVIDVFHHSDIHDYVTVVTEIGHQDDILEILVAAGFHEMLIPPELRNRPDKIKLDIQQQLQENQALVDQELDAIRDFLIRHKIQLGNIRNMLSQAKPYAALANSLSGKGELVYLEGWVPAGRQNDIHIELQENLANPYLLSFRQPTDDELLHVPSLQKNSRLLQPFQALVSQFGIPEYGEIDPTRLFAFSYTLMFGMMFGDIGHGAVIILMGYFFRKKIPGLMIFATFTGLSSITFGFFYGSLFGYEHIIHPVWMSPMEDPNKILLIALAWGIGFLIVANLISIRNLFAVKLTEQAIYSSKGIAGLAFFLGSIYAGYQFMAHQQFTGNEMLAIFLPLSLILFKQWKHIEGNFVERLLIITIEGLDNIINTLSSTLSFLRIAAFSLNHVALAAAVFTLAGMMDAFGHGVTILLGNIFIIVLEGGIVAIQCLRLEYYEGFSRFFSGKGQRFKPLKIESN